MKQLCVRALLCVFRVAADKPKDAGDEDRKALQGTWQVLEETHGDHAPEEEAKHCRFIFDHDKILIEKDGKTLFEGTIRIDASKSPRQIDLKITKDEEGQDRVGQTALGVYQVKGDTL